MSPMIIEVLEWVNFSWCHFDYYESWNDAYKDRDWILTLRPHAEVCVVLV